MKKTLFLMRHGQTLFNQLKRIQGSCDSPLTKEGKEQALKAREYFIKRGVEFDRIYSSTQERASDTLEIVTNREDYKRLKGVKEWDFGKFEGSSEYLNPPLKDGAISYEDYFVAYGGESVEDVSKRMDVTLRNILKEDGKNFLVVSHGGAIYSFFLNVHKNQNEHFHISNCTIFEYEYENEEFTLVRVINPVESTVIEVEK